MLKLEGLGFSQAEIVNELSQKLSCSKRVVYKDFETREWETGDSGGVTDLAGLPFCGGANYYKMYEKSFKILAKKFFLSFIEQLPKWRYPKKVLVD